MKLKWILLGILATILIAGGIATVFVVDPMQEESDMAVLVEAIPEENEAEAGLPNGTWEDNAQSVESNQTGEISTEMSVQSEEEVAGSKSGASDTVIESAPAGSGTTSQTDNQLIFFDTVIGGAGETPIVTGEDGTNVQIPVTEEDNTGQTTTISPTPAPKVSPSPTPIVPSQKEQSDTQQSDSDPSKVGAYETPRIPID